MDVNSFITEKHNRSIIKIRKEGKNNSPLNYNGIATPQNISKIKEILLNNNSPSSFKLNQLLQNSKVENRQNKNINMNYNSNHKNNSTFSTY